MLFVDRKYLLLISNSLRNFKERRANLFNCSCVFCGDSANDPKKARLYIYEHKNRLAVKCWNCGISTNLSKLLKQVNSDVYRQYCFEKFDKKVTPAFSGELSTPVEDDAILVDKPVSHDNLIPLSALPSTHPAVRYVMMERKISNTSDLYYTPDFKTLMDQDWPDHGKELRSDERLIWYMTNLDEFVTHVCGRVVGEETEHKLRYMKIRVQGEDGDQKIFGLTHADLNNPVYVLEGELDSLFIPNAVASGDSALEKLSDEIKDKFGVDTVVIFDNEARNKEIVKQMGRAIHGGHSVVVWPNLVAEKGKDINKMIQNGMTRETILEIIRDNTFTGTQAELEFMKWKKW